MTVVLLVSWSGNTLSGGMLGTKKVLLERSTLQRFPEQQEPVRVTGWLPLVTLVHSSSCTQPLMGLTREKLPRKDERTVKAAKRSIGTSLASMHDF